MHRCSNSTVATPRQTKAAKPKQEMGKKEFHSPIRLISTDDVQLKSPNRKSTPFFPTPQPATFHDETSQTIRSKRNRFAFGCIQSADRSSATISNKAAF